ILRESLESRVWGALRHNAKQEREYRDQKAGKWKKIIRKNPIKSFIELKFGKRKEE
ncbi:MAG: hypothetical protein GX163_03410, partial [Bacteroidetes bacterium]|nr:hypothetical protein [Bacteroidota bacterium]